MNTPVLLSETVINLFSIMSKWDDEFQLDDEPQRRKPKQDKKNRNSTSNNDFYDLEEDPKNVKLPTLGKNPPTTNQKNTKSTANINLAEIPKRKVEPTPPPKNSKYDEEEYEFQESLAPNPSVVKQKTPKVEQKKTVSPPKKEEKAEEEEVYANEEFQEEKYEEDFEAHEEHKPSPAGNKPKQTEKKQPQPQSKPVNVPKPVAKDRKGVQSVAKKAQVNKGNSRQSIRSQSASRSAQNSRAKPQQRKQQLPNKYTNLAQKTCPSYQRSTLQQCNMDRLTRQNDKIRNLIKKFNDELNDLINRNIMQLKSKKEEKVVVAEDVIKVLEEQRNSNETALQTTLKELQRLKGKEGELKEEEYHLTLDQRIAETKTAFTEISKAITKLKLQVNNEGNKLSKIDKEKQTNPTQQASNIKGNLITLKKQEEKNDEMLQKLYIKYEQLSKKITEAQSRHNAQMEEAKTKGLSVQINPQLIKKAEDIKKRIEISKLHKSKTENLIKTKSDMISHECDQVRMQSKAIDNSIQACINNCEEMQNESRKIVEKARKASKLSEDLLNTLQNIIAELEHATPVSNREKQDGSTFTHPKGAKKYQSQKNVEKLNPQPKEAAQTQDDSNLKKPTLFKKKEKEEEKQDQRVWKDDKNQEPKKPSPIPQLAKFQNKEEVQKKDDQKKKPFVIKKNKQTKPQPEPTVEPAKEQPKIQKIEKIQPKKEDKNEQAPSLAPRMMKFRRNKAEQGSKTEQSPKTIQKPAPAPKVQPKPQQKPIQQQVQKPIFAPKRFNLKLKDRTSEDAGYVATAIEKKEQPKPVQQFKPKGLTVQKQPFTLQPKPQPLKNIQPKITQNEQQEKPKFNLRLRDRQRQSNKPQIKVEQPQQPIKEPEPKIPIVLDDKAKENNQFTNPYANAEAPKRDREGPLKKQKVIQNAPKQNFNIYEQAQDITNVKELKTDSPKIPPPVQEQQPAKKTNDEPNLHDLLGIKKNKQSVDEDLLVDAGTLGNKGKNKRQSKKDTNFFGDLEI